MSGHRRDVMSRDINTVGCSGEKTAGPTLFTNAVTLDAHSRSNSTR